MRCDFGTKAADRLTFSSQRLDCFAFGQLGVADLGLQIADDTLGFGQRSFGPVARRGFSGERGFGSLQAAARGAGRSYHPAMCGWLESWLPSQDGNRNIAILHESTAVQSAVETITHAGGVIHSLRFGAVSLRFAHQPQCLAHL